MKYSKIFNEDKEIRKQPINVTDVFKESKHGKRYSQEEFIERLKILYGDKFDYSYINFINTSTPVKLYCKNCKEFFEALPSSLLRGHGHPGCNRWNTEKFVKYLKNRYGDVVDYSKTKYTRRSGKTIVVCPIHGEQEASISQLLDPNNKNVCPKCAKNHKKTKEEFIEEAIKIHGNKYDYSEIDFKGMDIKVKIFCKQCKDFFFQTPSAHLRGCGCFNCNAKRKRTTEEFIEEARKVHGDTYDYSKVIYENNITPVTIICKNHGEFDQKPVHHLGGAGCPQCAIEKQTQDQTLTQEEVIKRFKEVHGDKYDYSKVVYTKSRDKVIIRCKEHDYEFEQRPADHWSGQGCPLCARERIKKALTGTYEDFVEKGRAIHGDKFDYSLAKDYFKSWQDEVPILCLDCDRIFYQSPQHHIASRNGCPNCSSSSGEKYLESIFSSLGMKEHVDFIPQKSFDDLKYIRPLKFDFYLPKYNTCIEYQGEYHYNAFEDTEESKQDFLKSLERDQLKRNYCKENNINLIEIKYTTTPKEIEEFIKDYFNNEEMRKQQYIFIEKQDYREKRSKRFLERCRNEKDPDLYDYSLVNYINFVTPVEIINKKTGEHFWIKPANFLRK